MILSVHVIVSVTCDPHRYVETDVNNKERALAKLTPAKDLLSRFELGMTCFST